MKLQAFHNVVSLVSGPGIVEGAHQVDVQVIQDLPDHGRVGISFIHQAPHLVGKVLHGVVLGDSRMAQVSQWLSPIDQQ